MDTCDWCGKPIYDSNRDRYRYGTKRFCSIKCKNEYKDSLEEGYSEGGGCRRRFIRIVIIAIIVIIIAITYLESR